MSRRAVSVTALMAGLAVVGEAQEYRLSDESTLRYTLRFAGAGERTVTVRNLSGTIRVTGSRIDIDNVRGSGGATTVNGRITATLLDLPRRDAVFRTVNGAITATWPAQLAADLRMKTSNGDLFTDSAVVPLSSPPPTGTRRHGRLPCRANGLTLVRVGAGGPQLTFETHNGNVRVLRGAH
jgi:hypothetical protein